MMFRTESPTMLRCAVVVLIVLVIALFGCGPTPSDTPTPTDTPTNTPTNTPMATPTDTVTPTPSNCPSADAEGTISPAVAISSITFVVNGVEQVVHDFERLQALPGDQVQVREVTVCPVDPFEGSGGRVYVEFNPVDQTNGQIIVPEVEGSQAVGVTPGFTAIPGPDYTWTIGDNWRHISVVTVHYPPGGGTQNPSCEGGLCEVDDRVIVRITPVPSTSTPVLPTDTPVLPTPTPMAACPSADAEGTVPPAVAISSITFIVNGVEQVVHDFEWLQALPGDQVRVREVTVCPVDPFEGSGGRIYVEFDPVDQNAKVIASEIKGSRAMGVTSGFTAIPGPDYTWTIGDNWRHISVVTVHYPPGGGTKNPNCEGGLCEVDDRVIVTIQ